MFHSWMLFTIHNCMPHYFLQQRVFTIITSPVWVTFLHYLQIGKATILTKCLYIRMWRRGTNLLLQGQGINFSILVIFVNTEAGKDKYSIP